MSFDSRKFQSVVGLMKKREKKRDDLWKKGGGEDLYKCFANGVVEEKFPWWRMSRFISKITNNRFSRHITV